MKRGWKGGRETAATIAYRRERGEALARIATLEAATGAEDAARAAVAAIEGTHGRDSDLAAVAGAPAAAGDPDRARATAEALQGAARVVGLSAVALALP